MNLQAYSPLTKLVLIADAVRPFTTPTLIQNIKHSLNSNEIGVMPALKVHDTVKKVENGLVKETLDRSKLYLAQTPQGFCFHTILKLHQKYENKQ